MGSYREGRPRFDQSLDSLVKFRTEMSALRPRCVREGLAHFSFFAPISEAANTATLVLLPGPSNAGKISSGPVSMDEVNCIDCPARDICSGVISTSPNITPAGIIGHALLGRTVVDQPSSPFAPTRRRAGNPAQPNEGMRTNSCDLGNVKAGNGPKVPEAQKPSPQLTGLSSNVASRIKHLGEYELRNITCVSGGQNPRRVEIVGSEVGVKGGRHVQLSPTNDTSTIKLTIPNIEQNPSYPVTCNNCAFYKGVIEGLSGTLLQCSGTTFQSNHTSNATMQSGLPISRWRS